MNYLNGAEGQDRFCFPASHRKVKRINPLRPLRLCGELLRFELFRRFGLLAAAGDRHLAEFVPWFLTSRDSCFRWGFCLTPYSYRSQRYRNAPKYFRQVMKNGTFPKLSRSGEEYLNQMLAIVGQGTLKTNL